jgi:hypothetical protein
MGKLKERTNLQFIFPSLKKTFEIEEIGIEDRHALS